MEEGEEEGERGKKRKKKAPGRLTGKKQRERAHPLGKKRQEKALLMEGRV